jgi:antitoxin (DNA-binding transcriptional repressor) of toxin-antitoxin stability system
MLVCILSEAASMLRKIDSTEVRTRFHEILLCVEAGEAFTITCNGKLIADVVPSRSSNRLKTEAAIAAILKAKKHNTGNAVLIELKETGRK